MKKHAPTLINTERETRVFFGFMTLVFGGMYVWVVSTDPQLRQPLRLVAFTILMNVHIILHWMLRVFVKRPGWMWGYPLVQGSLAIMLVAMAPNIGFVLSLFMGLIGEAVGVYGLTRRGALATAYYLVLSLGCYAFLYSLAEVGWWILGTIPMLVFVIMYVEMYTRQANANERAQQLLDELQTANQQLTEYAGQVEDLTITNERQRMARELHDTLSQGLAGLILQLEAADAHLAGGRPEKAQSIVKQTMERARSVLAEARQAIDDLRRPTGNDLEAALHQEVARFCEANGIACDAEISLSGLRTSLPAERCETVLRVVAEALTNTARHARAHHVCVKVTANDNELYIFTGDDGCGFDPAVIPPGHYGLLGMRERIRMAGGTMEIESAPGKGTSITVLLPLEIEGDK
ncbi:MAG: sensor histidine kinase [Chloroflexota bacterium]